MKKLNPFLILGLGIFLIVLFYGGYLFIKNTSVSSGIDEADAVKLQLTDELTVYQEKNLEQAISAKKMVDFLNANDVNWSYIIQEIRDTLPQNDKGEYIVDILSYSGTPDNKISLNIQTVPNTSDPYSSVASVISAFDNSKSFKDNFVASIGGGMTPFGQQILTFTLTTTYAGESVPAKNSTPSVKKVDNSGANAVKKPVSR
jgi:hypothetical protein